MEEEKGMKMATFAALALVALTTAASGDRWKDESGKGHWLGEYRHEYRNPYARDSKEEFRRGNCKIGRKRERSGELEKKTGASPCDDDAASATLVVGGNTACLDHRVRSGSYT